MVFTGKRKRKGSGFWGKEKGEIEALCNPIRERLRRGTLVSFNNLWERGYIGKSLLKKTKKKKHIMHALKEKNET